MCGVLLKTPKSSARNSNTAAKNEIQTIINQGVNYWMGKDTF
jgi:hypothetical protein